MARALLFDVGDVLMKSNWEMFDELHAVTGRVVSGRGPLDPDGDPDWGSYLDGGIEWSEYWERKARGGGFDDRWAMWREICLRLDSRQFAADALALVDEARRAGVAVGVLSNDLVLIGGRAWVDTRPELAGYDAFVDATELGVRKPAPEPYLAAIEQLGLPAGEIVFLDDLPMCVEGARAVGMIGLHVDPTNRALAFERARQLVGLVPAPEPMQIAAALTSAYRAGDTTAASALFHPEVLVSCNGVVVGTGVDAARAFHARVLAHANEVAGIAPIAVDRDTISLEWLARPARAEIWTVRYGRIVELRAFGAPDTVG